MAQRMLNVLHELWPRVEEALARWIEHLESIAKDTDHEFRGPALEKLSCEARIEKLDANRTIFQRRVDAINHINAVEGRTAPLIGVIIAAQLEDPVGLETVTNMFRRALTQTEDIQDRAHQRIAEIEVKVTDRFTTLRGQYEGLCKLLGDDLKSTTNYRFDEIEEYMLHFQAIAAMHVGVESPRQTLVLEYFQKVSGGTLSVTITLGSDRVAGESPSGRQRLISEFFKKL